MVQPFKGLVGVRQAYADAGCQADGAVFPHRKLQRITDLGRLAVQQFFGNARPGQENRKLIPAKPAYDIAGPEQAGQHPGRFPDRLVASLVAKRIVDLFEIVKIQDKQRAGFLRQKRGKPAADFPLHRIPVEQAGQRIPAGAAQQFFQAQRQFFPRGGGSFFLHASRPPSLRRAVGEPASGNSFLFSVYHKKSRKCTDFGTALPGRGQILQNLPGRLARRPRHAIIEAQTYPGRRPRPPHFAAGARPPPRGEETA